MEKYNYYKETAERLQKEIDHISSNIITITLPELKGVGFKKSAVLDILADKIFDYIEACEKHGNRRSPQTIAALAELAETLEEDFKDTLTPESIGIIDGKVPDINRESMPYWKNRKQDDDA